MLSDPGLAPLRILAFVAFFALASLNAWSFTLVVLGIGQRKLDQQGRGYEAAGALSLPIYLIHHPVIVIVGFFVVQLALPTVALWLVLLFSAVAITWGLILLFIMPYDPIRVLLGIRSLAKGGPQVRLLPRLRLLWAQVIFVALLLVFMGLLIAAI